MKLSAVSLVLLSTLSFGVMADATNDWTFRIGAAHISPDDSSGPVLGNDGVSVDSSTGLGFSLEFPIGERWGFEVLGALPFSHDINGTGALSGLKIGEVKHLPPTFSALYYFNTEKTFHVGVGLNYTTFIEDKTSAELTSALGANSTDLDLDDSFGYSIKLGFDIPLSSDWNFSGNLYYMDIDTNADVIVNGTVATTVEVEIDPWVAMIGLSTRF